MDEKVNGKIRRMGEGRRAMGDWAMGDWVTG